MRHTYVPAPRRKLAYCTQQPPRNGKKYTFPYAKIMRKGTHGTQIKRGFSRQTDERDHTIQRSKSPSDVRTGRKGLRRERPTSTRIRRGSPPAPNATAASTSRQSSLVVGSSWWPRSWETRRATCRTVQRAGGERERDGTGSGGGRASLLVVKTPGPWRCIRFKTENGAAFQ